MQPKKVLNDIKHRHHSIGKERRLNMSKLILDKSPNFPLSVELKDIDATMNEWVDKELDLSFDGKRLPTFKLYSNQRINEYAQSWNHLDETGNLLMNFKAITRENNPEHGTSQGSYFNIPGNRDYPMFIVPILQENGLQAYDMYSMKQPFSVDLIYSLTIITNKYELINEMNMLVNDKFKAINCYIFPNQHPMPLTLESITDESEYAIDDRKYYSQTYKMKLKAYIIREEDFKVTHLDSRLKMVLNEEEPKHGRRVEIEEQEDRFNNLSTIINIHLPSCDNEIDFTMDCDLVIDEIEVDNIFDFAISVNDEYIDPQELTNLYKDDNVFVKISKDNDFIDAILTLKGKNPNESVDNENNAEVSLDEKPTEEVIDVG